MDKNYLIFITIIFIQFIYLNNKINNSKIEKLSNDEQTAVINLLRNTFGISMDRDNIICSKNLQARNGMAVEGKLYFRHNGANGGDDTDPYFMEKVRTSPDNNTLRLTINDNGGEAFEIWGNSCGSTGGCGGEGRKLFYFKADGECGIPNLLIADKWRFKDTDDSILRIYGKTGAYYGGIAAGSLWSGSYLRLKGDIFMENGKSIRCKGRLYIHPQERLYLLPKGGLFVTKDWEAPGTAQFDGNVLIKDNLKIDDNLEVVGTTNFPTERIDISPTDLENKIRNVYGNEVDLKHLIDIHK